MVTQGREKINLIGLRIRKVQGSESEASQRDARFFFVFFCFLQHEDLFTKKAQKIQLRQSAYFDLTKQECGGGMSCFSLPFSLRMIIFSLS